MQDHLGYTQDRPAVNSKNTEMRYKQDHLGYMQDGNLTTLILTLTITLVCTPCFIKYDPLLNCP